MKKNYLSLLAVLLFTFNMQAQEAPEVQKSLITKVTATWCPPCGSWGWELFSGLVQDNNQKALVIANHYSGDLTNDTAEDIASNFNITSQPRFILDNMDQSATNNTADAKRIAIKEAVDTNYELAPVVNAGIEAILDGNELTVNAKTHFFQDASGEYFINAYIIENGVINFQASQGQGAVHKNVLRTGIFADFFGDAIVNGDVTSGTEFDHTFTTTLNSNWEVDNLSVAIIIWKKEENSNSYMFVNTHSVSTFETPTTNSVAEISADELMMKVLPTVSNGNANLTVEVIQAQTNLQIDIFNSLGQLQSNVFSGNANTGTQTFAIGNNLNTGVYNVVARVGDRVSNVRFIIQR